MIDLFHCVLKFPKLLQEPFKADTNLEHSLASGREEIDGKFCTDFPALLNFKKADVNVSLTFKLSERNILNNFISIFHSL